MLTVIMKSNLSRSAEYQNLWEDFKNITGDPFLAIVSNNEVFNLNKNTITLNRLIKK